MNDELLDQLRRFVAGLTDDSRRPELGDSYGNYDDSYYDGYRAAEYDLRQILKEHGVL